MSFLMMVGLYLVIGFVFMSMCVYFNFISEYESPIFHIVFWPVIAFARAVMYIMDVSDGCLSRYIKYLRSVRGNRTWTKVTTNTK